MEKLDIFFSFDKINEPIKISKKRTIYHVVVTQYCESCNNSNLYLVIKMFYICTFILGYQFYKNPKHLNFYRFRI